MAKSYTRQNNTRSLGVDASSVFPFNSLCTLGPDSLFSLLQGQPQLLAILCLMRYEDWTFREAEVRLSEHRELRQVLGLVSVPDFTTLYRFLQRLDDQTIDRAVGETVRRLRGSLRQKRKRARVAVDATATRARLRFWRRERRARSLCGACIITGKNRCRGGTG